VVVVVVAEAAAVLVFSGAGWHNFTSPKFRERVKNVVTSKGIGVGTECK
jgi:hypothetical protein